MPDLSPYMQSPTIAAIEAAVEHAHQEPRRTYLGASVIGKPCERALWYEFRWAFAPEKFEGRMLRLFETGHLEEARMIEWLRMAGVNVVTQDPHSEDDSQIAVKFCEGHGGGHLDGECWGVKEAPKAVHVAEFKTHNAKSFAQLKKHGVAVAKPEHVAQMQIYMHQRGRTRGLYVAKCKDNDELYIERIEYNADQAIRLLAKAQRIIDADAPPARISDDPNSFACRFCHVKDACHSNAFAQRNCRTCIHASPVNGGAWQCARHQKHLDRETQESGCAHHLYLPGLVPGDQVDVDQGAETITYQLSSGVIWTDGEAA